VFLGFVYSRIVEETEASIGDVTDELDELRRSFSARLRSESLQRKSENLEKGSKIEMLETILLSQLRREEAKDRKIAELEEKVEEMVQLNEMPEQRQELKLHEERTSLLPKDAIIESEMEKGKSRETENENRLRDNTAQVATPGPLIRENKSDTIHTPSLDEIQQFESLDEDGKEIPVHGRSLSAKQISRRGKLSSLLKRKSTQNKIT